MMMDTTQNSLTLAAMPGASKALQAAAEQYDAVRHLTAPQLGKLDLSKPEAAYAAMVTFVQDEAVHGDVVLRLTNIARRNLNNEAKQSAAAIMEAAYKPAAAAYGDLLANGWIATAEEAVRADKGAQYLAQETAIQTITAYFGVSLTMNTLFTGGAWEVATVVDPKSMDEYRELNKHGINLDAVVHTALASGMSLACRLPDEAAAVVDELKAKEAAEEAAKVEARQKAAAAGRVEHYKSFFAQSQR